MEQPTGYFHGEFRFWIALSHRGVLVIRMISSMQAFRRRKTLAFEHEQLINTPEPNFQIS